MRLVCSALLVGAVFVVVIAIGTQNRVEQEPMLYRYVTRRFKADTDAHNAVAALLLNYRMYDTLFEALILLTAIIGMHQFLPRNADIDAGEEMKRE